MAHTVDPEDYAGAPEAPTPQAPLAPEPPITLEQGQAGFQALLVLSQLHRGDLLSTLEDSLDVVTQAVTESGKKGSVSLTITMAPAPRGDGNVLLVNATLSEKAPKVDRSDALFYASKNGTLSRQDPRQATLDFDVRPMPAADPTPLRRVDTAAG